MKLQLLGTIPVNHCIEIHRHFDVSPEAVFDILTKPECIRAWLDKNQGFDISLTENGHWKIVRLPIDGATFTIKGHYTKLNKPSLIEYTFKIIEHTFPEGSVSLENETISIQLDRQGPGCRVTFKQSGENTTAELLERDQGELCYTEKWWGKCFDTITAMLSRNRM